jgi:hypothetical protein
MPVAGFAVVARRILEEEGDRHAENRRDVLQAACADTVRALLVFLDLLERDAERLAQLLLAHAEHGPAQPDSAADVDIYRIGLFLVSIILSS